jgi:glycosyltransferase involved in cell wall biosynthesis
VVHNGVDAERFSKACDDFDRESYLISKNIPPDKLLVASIGELRKLKRHDDFIRAAAIVAKEVKGVHFVIAGVDTSPKGETKLELIQLAEELNLTDNVHFLGWLDDADKLLCASDLFVSASETESFGLSMAEAMAASTPVVATMTEGAQEVIENGITGLLVPIGDVERIAQSMVQLLTNDGARARLGQQASKAVCERFSLKRMVDEVERLYLET